MTVGHEEDPISATSAGLRALGVAPHQRFDTLGLLAVLLDLADTRGEVALDDALIAAEQRLGLDACLDGYEWLERLGVIRRTWSGWHIEHFAHHGGPAGLTEASMGVLRRHIGPPVARHAAAATPDNSGPVVTLRPWRRRVPAIAASVAAGVALLAGANQLVPQAAVSQRDAVVRSTGTTGEAPAAPSPVKPAAGTTPPTVAGVASPAPVASTTTTSTTLLPNVACLGDAVDDLATRSGLGLSVGAVRDTGGLPPGLLPCP